MESRDDQVVEDDSRSGRFPITDENIEEVSNLVRSNRRLSFHAIDESIRMSAANFCHRKRVKLVPLSTKSFLAKYNIRVLDHPPNSLVLAPCDFYNAKSALKGTICKSLETREEKAARVLKILTEKDFQHCCE
ncbi:uncharacterized protein LOC130903952 [Diorhabda carinulata]|uniref:uncharacterized protein LOC130903952 n=1 Tax=Diorhabda carinulata TaxID=1163345 RepID=UPI0025A17397|nr:uncharacterized protein LOC130903952 [Diorhabda carinulata]